MWSVINHSVFPGYVAVEESETPASTEIFSQLNNGTKYPWSIISYANGLGFNKHFVKGTKYPWKDLRILNWKDDQYR